jgi:2-amino-4-hydroxy-6-hydroxymethyldihydropteridine diphosphokinase
MGREAEARALRYAGCAGIEIILRLVNPNLTASKLVVVALGSNLGDSPRIVWQAMDRLQLFSSESILKSSLWQTTPVDCPPGSPIFVNAVIVFLPRAGETPESLLGKLQALEKEFGRQPKKVLNEARALDLDIIAFGRETRNESQLILPHPRAHQRRFVLQPLSEITPDLILPGQSKTVAQLLQELPPDETMKKLS